MSKTPQEIANTFAEATRKGFLRVIVLYILNKSPSHGYGIQSKIKEVTRDAWFPPLGSIYGVLNWLETEELIDVASVEEGTPSGKKKVYDLTQKGKVTLGIVAENIKEWIKSINAIVVSLFGLDVSFAMGGLPW